MPTYEYRCKSCGHEMEVQQAFSDAPLETCPECQGPLRKVYGNVGISFKGSGFYKNDARSSGSSKSSKSSSSSSSDSGSTSSDSGSSSSGEKATAGAASSGD
ncbi:MAG TPA: FmdB family zinc ribbon protein [Acidimicrobiales bacterium]|nr:FmdB family zinc ribbon protein [Acidimicrobiales bacterium]